MIKKLMERRRRMLYRRAMMDAIEEARMMSYQEVSASWSDTGRFNPVRCPSRSDALRSIRCFEVVNGLAFDPFNSQHRAKIRASASGIRKMLSFCNFNGSINGGRLESKSMAKIIPGLRLEPQLQR